MHKKRLSTLLFIVIEISNFKDSKWNGVSNELVPGPTLSSLHIFLLRLPTTDYPIIVLLLPELLLRFNSRYKYSETTFLILMCLCVLKNHKGVLILGIQKINYPVGKFLKCHFTDENLVKQRSKLCFSLLIDSFIRSESVFCSWSYGRK